MTETFMMTSGMVLLEITRRQENVMVKAVTHPVNGDTMMTAPIFAEILHPHEMTARTLNRVMAETI